MPKDLQIESWGFRISVAESKGLPLRTGVKELQSIVSAFAENINRVGKLCTFPSRMFLNGQMYSNAWAYACHEILGAPYPDWSDGSHESQMALSDITGLADDYRHGRKKPPHPIGAGAVTRDMLDFSGAHEEYETLMLIQIVGAWTAVETLLGDLWELALNLHPRGLSELKGHHKPARAASSQSQDGQKTLRLSELQKYDFNLTDKMGTVLRKRVRFTSLEDARDAYRRAFWKDQRDIESALSNRSLDALSVMRNVIIHKASVADEEYTSRSKSLPSLPQVDNGKTVELNGALVSGLVQPCADCCIQLIKAVDGWLLAHPDK